ncbi:hypothetical protein C5Y93_09845 [Blastopirellula marina]|uniref:Leucine-rich repeat domain-containing protein n=2 Tax=Blastopirellula marina TaxID=124 RepID=A0A2S8GPD0_9BACT|nr:hypothetical protein C5Y93_09845 [Blastopirellula marina]
MLVLVLLASLPLAWIGREFYRAHYEHWYAESAARYGGSVTHESFEATATAKLTESFPGENWLRYVLDIERKPRLTTVCLVSQESISLVNRLPYVQQLDGVVLCDMTLSDREVHTLLSLPNLKRLILHDVDITPDQLARFIPGKQLTKLQLDGRNATDTNLKVAGQMTQLQEIILRDGSATNAGAAHLRGLADLRSFTALRTEIDYESIPVFAKMSQLSHLQLEPNHPQPEWDMQWSIILAGLPLLPRYMHSDDPILHPPGIHFKLEYP